MDRDEELLQAAWAILRRCEDGSTVFENYAPLGEGTVNGEELADEIAEHLGMSVTDHPDTENL